MLGESNALLDEPRGLGLSEAEGRAHLTLSVEHLLEGVDHLDRAELFLTEQLDRIIAVEGIEKVGHLPVAETLHASRLQDATIERLKSASVPGGG